MLQLLRYTLDLFDNLAVEPARTPSVTGSGVVPSQAGDGAVPLVYFSHPEANRSLRLGNALVAYQFTRARRRTIGFVVGAEGLSVRAPRYVSLREVDAAVQEKADWIVRKLQEMQERQRRQDDTRVQWQDGVVLPYLGAPISVRLDPSKIRSGKVGQLHPSPSSTAPATAQSELAQSLYLGLAPTATAQQLRDAVQQWLMQQARQNFETRMAHYAPLLGVRWTKLRLSNAATRWGSASADGSIRLNWRLIHLSQSVIDYVVAHELSHLRVMNHSPQFWATVASVVPDYAVLRRQLKTDAVPKW